MLKRVSIQNFKSLKDVTLDLQKVNLLIGPNNSGKTNFLKALEYFGKSTQPYEDNFHLDNLSYKYQFGAVYIHLKYPVIDDISIFGKSDFTVMSCTISPSNNVREVWGQSLEAPYAKISNVDDKKTFADHFREKLGYVTVYKPDPNQFIKPGDFSADAIELEGDCSNLIQFLFYLSTSYKRAYQNIENDLARCVGDILSISTPPVKIGNESKLGLKFFGRNDEDFWAEDVSEGVLYFLALVTIINQPNPPKLLLLEEPEKGIHPRRIREVMDFIFRLAEEKDVQIILTTHSPIVVDMFKDMPESVFIFDKDEEGATHVKNLQRDVIEPETEKSKALGIEPHHYTDSLGDAWTVGFLGGVPK